MSPNLLKYSNGWGHLIMSVCSQVIAVILLLQHDGTLTGIATGLILTVTGYWFVTSSAHAQQVAGQQQGTTIQVTPPAPAVTVVSPSSPSPATPGGPNV